MGVRAALKREADWLEFFDHLGDVFMARFMEPLWSKYPDRDSEEWSALSIFLEGYAFERQGRNPSFGPAAAKVAMSLRAQRYVFHQQSVAQDVWRGFKKELVNRGLNEVNNPLCPNAENFGKSRDKSVSGQSIVELLMKMTQPNIVLYTKAGLKQDDARKLHEELGQVNGVGPKIISLWLRDVALAYHIVPATENRHLLQPIDVWVRRTVELIGKPYGPNGSPPSQNPARDKAIAWWIVQQSHKAGFNAEKVNQGMWYFASQVAGSEHRLTGAMHEAGIAETLLDKHGQALRSAVAALG